MHELLFSVFCSWTVLRCQQQDPSYDVQPEPEAAQSFSDSWGMDADDWGDEEDFPALETSTGGNGATWGTSAGASTGGGGTTWGKDVKVGGNNDINSLSVGQAQSSSVTKDPTPPKSPELPELEDATADLEAMSIDSETSETLITEDLGIKPDESILSKMLLQEQSNSVVETNIIELQGRFISVIEEPRPEKNFRHEEKLLRDYAQKEGVNVEKLKKKLEEGPVNDR